MRLVTRAQWGARTPLRRVHGELSDESTCHWNGPKVTVGGKDTWDHSRCAQLVRGIQNFHMDTRGWSDIAYNFLECPHGYTFEGRGLNIVNGANGTNDGNRSSHAICCLAGEGNPFPITEKSGFKTCVAHIAEHTNAPNRCKGHRDHKSTECPGDERYGWVHAGMPVTSTPPPPPVQKEDSLMLQILWFEGNTTDDKWPDGTDAAYEVLFAQSAVNKDKEIMVEATWIPNETVLNARRFSLGGVESSTRHNPKKFSDAGVRIYGGPYKNR